MEVYTSAEDLKAIENMAVQNGTSTAEQARRMLAEAVQRGLDYDRWFTEQVLEGLAAADRGELLEHDAVKNLIDERFSG